MNFSWKKNGLRLGRTNLEIMLKTICLCTLHCTILYTNFPYDVKPSRTNIRVLEKNRLYTKFLKMNVNQNKTKKYHFFVETFDLSTFRFILE